MFNSLLDIDTKISTDHINHGQWTVREQETPV